MTEMLCVEDFPDEIIVNIMMYLSLPDRKNVRLVNHRWCNLSYSARLTKDDVLVVNHPSDLLMLNYNRKYFNIKIKNLSSDFSKFDLSFWAKCGNYVRSLEIYLFAFSNLQILREVFKFSPNLEYLLISQYDENDKSKAPIINYEAYDLMNLPKLLSLDLLHLNEKNSKHLYYFLTSAPKLKRLSLEWLIGDWLVSLEDTLKSFAKQHSSVLKEVNFSYSSISSDFLTTVLSEISSQLTGLYLRRCRMLEADCLNVIKSNFPNLKEIDLSYNLFNEDVLCSFFESLVNLTHVSLLKTQASGDLVSILLTKSKLKALELSECKFRPGSNWSLNFSASNCSNLIDLRLDRVPVLNDDIKILAKNAVNLIFLSLNGCLRLNDESLKCISNYCTRLRSLSLQNLPGLKDVSVVNNLKGLIHYDLYGCQRVTDRSLSRLALLELQTIDMSSTNLTINSLSNILDNCPSIQDIYLGIEMENEVNLLRETRNICCKVHFGLARFTADSIFDN